MSQRFSLGEAKKRVLPLLDTLVRSLKLIVKMSVDSFQPGLSIASLAEPALFKQLLTVVLSVLERYHIIIHRPVPIGVECVEATGLNLFSNMGEQ